MLTIYGKCGRIAVLDYKIFRIYERDRKMKKNLNRRQYMYGFIMCIILLFTVGVFNFVGDNYYIAFAEIAAGVAILAYMIVESKIRLKDMAEFMSYITGQSGSLTNEVISRFPKPMLVLSIDGKIVWYNDKAIELFAMGDLYDVSLPQVMPQLKWTEILKTTEAFEVKVDYNNRHYALMGSIIARKDESSGKDIYSVVAYFDDITVAVELEKRYENEKVDVAMIAVDNYDDVFQVMDDNKSQETMAKINSAVSKWVAQSNGVLKKIGSDRYIAFFEHQYLDAYIKDKFDILEKIRSPPCRFI